MVRVCIIGAIGGVRSRLAAQLLGRGATFCHRISALILITIVAACAPTPPSPAAVPPTPTVSDAAPTDTATPAPPTVAPSPEAFPERTDSMKIRITLEDAVLTATLVESQTAEDFISLLPLTLTLEDYAGTEKVSDLPRRLSTEGAPSGSDPSVGDITYYAPWGNLAIFYRDFGYASGLVILGKIESGIEALNVPGSVSGTIELVE